MQGVHVRRVLQQGEDVVGGSGSRLQPREDVGEAVIVGAGAGVGHRVGGQGDVEAGLISLAGRCLDARPSRHAGDDDLRHAQAPQPSFQVGGCECAPGPLGHPDVTGLGVEFGDNVGESGREGARRPAGLFGPAGRHPIDGDEDDRQTA